ncbi:MAG: hypothetical protein DI579_05110 [Lawsonella clevelandensis]|uniref:Uncharacterized protein n=1 Tax=Lawsonella clevelandensis TaxID=1528099 RepID=A0A2W5K8E6_9ACTN|nr:MAG: hypothetical protein DI579_05110 [Lawsonella clevelandensis]
MSCRFRRLGVFGDFAENNADGAYGYFSVYAAGQYSYC